MNTLTMTNYPDSYWIDCSECQTICEMDRLTPHFVCSTPACYMICEPCILGQVGDFRHGITRCPRCPIGRLLSFELFMERAHPDVILEWTREGFERNFIKEAVDDFGDDLLFP